MTTLPATGREVSDLPVRTTGHSVSSPRDKTSLGRSMQKIGTVAASYPSARLVGANVSGDRSDNVVQTALRIAFPSLCRLKTISADRVRWLLLSPDRLPSNDLKMTQQLIANMLGLRRPGVPDAAMKLQDAGLIRYGYGNIEVQDRIGLKKCTCECYPVLTREFDRLLPEATIRGSCFPARRRFPLQPLIPARLLRGTGLRMFNMQQAQG
jgi:hypothetical protein